MKILVPKNYFIISALFLIFFNCGKQNKFKVDVSSIQVSPTIIRWDSLMVKRNPFSISDLVVLKSQSPELLNYFAFRVLQLKNLNDSVLLKEINLFKNHNATVETQAQIYAKFQKIDSLNDAIINFFKHVKYYYPGHELQKVIYLNSIFNMDVFCENKVIAVSLDVYIGKNNPLSTKAGIPQYIKNNMEKNYILSDIARDYIWFTIKPGIKNEETLLSQLIFRGKILYASQAFLPNNKETDLIKYTKEQWDFCTKMEGAIWRELIKNNWLYTTDEKIINEFVNDAPFTIALGKDAPPRVGIWLGWQIVKDYMKKNPSVTLQDLLKLDDEKLILNAYEPKN